MDNNNVQQTTFWNFLQNHKIEIPIIQRDYAQGRIGKEKLREKFLMDMKDALDGKLSNNDKVLKLDFVYGSVENECLNPLDGQQRLTTLWLLHWFIAFKAGKLSESNNIFKRFSYETRTSSREFCKKLSEFELNSEKPVVEQIQNQTWFFSAWKQDPTIQAMLHMLGGTPILDEKKIDILDGIEEVFVECDFINYWEVLAGPNCPIIFYFLDLLDLKLSDDLYIKMNARGKALTNFENFKADLVGQIKLKKWEKGISPENTIAHKLDTIWTDIFWKYKSEEHKIDEIYFTFLKRYFLNSLITAKKNENVDNEDSSTMNRFWFTAEKLEQSDNFKNIWSLGLEYTSFDLFKPKKEDIEIFDYKLFDRLIKIFDNFHEAFKNTLKDDVNKLFYPPWENDFEFRFITDYIENSNFSANNTSKELKFIPRTITQAQRVVFHSICCYFANGQYNVINFRQWLRVIWNIVENANINGTQPMIGAMRLIDDLAYFSHDIYTHLIERDVSKDFAKDQMEEEKEKAKQILTDNNNTWENRIIEAEKTAFFNGSIRFLFTTDVNVYDWDKFDEKLKNCQKYFNSDGVKNGLVNYKADAILLKALISRCSDFENYVWNEKYIFDNKAATWKKNILLNNVWNVSVNDILLGKIDIKSTETSLLFRNLFESNLLNYVAEEMPGSRMRWIHDHKAIYQPRYSGIILDDDNYKRNEILSKLYNDNQIESNQKITNCDFFRGWDINFKYKDKNNGFEFQWNTDNNIYLLENKERRRTEDGKFVYFSMNNIEKKSYQNFIDWMRNCSE